MWRGGWGQGSRADRDFVIAFGPASPQYPRSQFSATEPTPGHSAPLVTAPAACFFMRDDYLKAALGVVEDPTILVNVVSRRVKQLRRGNRPLVESLEKLSTEDTALREVAERKISYDLGPVENGHSR